MAIPEPAFLVLFVLAAIGALAGLGFTLLRGERVGSVECPLVYPDRLTRMRLTVAREGLAAGASSRVQVRVSVPMMFTVLPLEPGDALRLADLLESGAAKSRAP